VFHSLKLQSGPSGRFLRIVILRIHCECDRLQRPVGYVHSDEQAPLDYKIEVDTLTILRI
jgi:hypothetical protein